MLSWAARISLLRVVMKSLVLLLPSFVMKNSGDSRNGSVLTLSAVKYR